MSAPRRARLLGLVLFVLLSLVTANAALVAVHRSMRGRLEEELGQRLIAVGTGAAAAVDPGTWAGLAAGDPAARDALRDRLEELRRENGASTIFIFDAEQITLLDLAGQYPGGEPNPALKVDLEAVTTALAGWPAATRLYSSRGQYLKSAYAPIRSEGGAILGGAGVEATAGFFAALGEVRKTLFLASGFVSGGLLLLGVLFARLLAARDALEARLRRAETLAGAGQMTAMLAHDIRNPLGIIRGAAERLGERHGLAEDELFRFIPEEVDRLQRTLNVYLEFARPRGAPVGGEDLREALGSTLEFLDAELARKGITVEADLEEGRFPVRGEGPLLRQAFLNVILNARDALEASGGRIHVRLRRRGNGAVVEIRDTGPGMSEDVLRRAGEPFFTTKAKGSGLGLAMVRRVMDDVRGHLELSAKPGEGTRVTLFFPGSAPEAPIPPANAGTESSPRPLAGEEEATR